MMRDGLRKIGRKQAFGSRAPRRRVLRDTDCFPLTPPTLSPCNRGIDGRMGRGEPRDSDRGAQHIWSGPKPEFLSAQVRGGKENLGVETVRRVRRRGLAPLEFVLWLPVFMFVMALMVNFGMMATWRMRGEVVSHDAVMRVRSPRTADNEAGPGAPVWPAPADMNVRADRPIVQLDDPQLISQRIRGVVRGPLPNNFVVRPLLDPLRGNLQGTAQIDRPYPLLPRLGPFTTGTISNPLLDREWTNHEMGIPNVSRRTLALYDMPFDHAGWARFESEWRAIPSIADFAALRVLEYDDDWVYYGHEYRDWHFMGTRDFHPFVIPDRCTLNFREIRQQKVEPLIDIPLPNGRRRLGEVTRLPRTLTSAFLAMFRRTKAAMEAELKMLTMNPPPGDPNVGAKIAFIMRELPIVDSKISQLERFEKRIPSFEARMATRP